MRVMISQPMRGKTKEQIVKEREEAVKLLEAQGHEVVDSIINTQEDGTNRPLYCLARSLDIMAKCDGVCFIGDWHNARGCRIEHEAAEQYGLWVVLI